MRRGSDARQIVNPLEKHAERDIRECTAIALGENERGVSVARRLRFQVAHNLSPNARGKNDTPAFWSFRLMRDSRHVSGVWQFGMTPGRTALFAALALTLGAICRQTLLCLFDQFQFEEVFNLRAC